MTEFNIDDFEIVRRKEDEGFNIDDFEFVSTPTKSFDVDEDNNTSLAGKLKKSDLKKGKNATAIRQYMIDRKGNDYRFDGNIDDDQLVEDFFGTMRFFNTNVVSTATEARFIGNADEEKRARAAKAYELYDQTGNVFVNDGVFGAVDGIKDYIFAAATDPFNYIGLATGFVGKAAAMGVTKGGKELVKQSAKEAIEAAMKSGATREGAEKAGREAQEKVIGRLVESGIKNPAKNKKYKKILQEVGDREQNLFRLEAVKKAKNDFKNKQKDKYIYQSVGGTVVIDSTLSALNDYQIQSTLMEAGSQNEYSTAQTLFSFGLGGIAGGVQLGGIALKGAGTGLNKGLSVKDAVNLRDQRDKLANKVDSVLDTKTMKAARDSIKKDLKTWAQKIKEGDNIYGSLTSTPDAFKVIFLGVDGTGKTGGLARVFADAGKPLPKDKLLADTLTNITKDMPQKDLKDINEILKNTSITLGDMASAPGNLAGLASKSAHEAGQILNTLSQTRKIINGGILRADDTLTDQVTGVIKGEEGVENSPRYAAHLQSVWKRMLVSSPATTSVNVAGFTQFALGQTLADALQSGSFIVAGHLAKLDGKTEVGEELIRKGQVYGQMINMRAKYLMDANTTHDAYMQFLQTDDKLAKVLNETMSGGVQQGEANAKRFGFDTANGYYKTSEAITKASTTLTGVRIQDTFTKSQMFMAELDKHLRLNKKKSLGEILNEGSTNLIDDASMSAALDSTLKSVFAKNYTQGTDLASQIAKRVEDFSNTPGLGLVLPFGRFMNNVVATAYQWSPIPMMEVIGTNNAFAKALGKEPTRTAVEESERFARAAVGTGALIAAIQFDNNKRDKNLPYYQVESADGTIIDVKNLFPFSAWLAAGRIYNMSSRGETPPREMYEELGNQFAIGQAATDLQFGNDLFNILDMAVEGFSGDGEQARSIGAETFGRKVGTVTAGFTRPLDFANRLVGYVADVGFDRDIDVAKDPRQATGIANSFGVTSTKYVDNLVEIFSDKVDGITGEELRVATRGGSLRDANPLAKILGVTIAPARTATEEVYSVAMMHPWKASERSEIPAYDKAFNNLLAPLLEKESRILLKDDTFINANLDRQRSMLKTSLRKVRKEVKEIMEASSGSSYVLRMRRSAVGKGRSKETRQAAKRHMKSKGYETSVRDMSVTELIHYMDYIKAYDEMYGK